MSGPGAIGARATTWRLSRNPPLAVGHEHLVTKLTEELGEVAKAVIGDLEMRAGRGDVRQEVAQVGILLEVLLWLHYPGLTLQEAMEFEMEAMGA